MKKLLVVLSLLATGFSIQASAATLQWTGHSISGPVANSSAVEADDQHLSGGVDFNGTSSHALTHTWTYSLDQTAKIDNFAIEFFDNQLDVTSVTLDGNNLFSQASYGIRTWFYTGFLTAGEHNLVLNIAKVLSASAQYDLKVGVNEVPIPAAVWLFGSAFAGMLGFKRRKVA